MGPVAWRHGAAKLTVWSGPPAERPVVSGIVVNVGREDECASVSRCTVALFGLQQSPLNGPKAALPPDFDLELWGSVAGRWVRLVGFVWNPAAWEDTGVLWWRGGLCEGFLVVGGAFGVDAAECNVSVRWLADRLGDAAFPMSDGATATVDVTVVP